MAENALGNEENIGEDITRGDFNKAMEELKKKKGPGLDEIPAELLATVETKLKMHHTISLLSSMKRV